MKSIGATTKRSSSKKKNIADVPRTETQEEAAVRQKSIEDFPRGGGLLGATARGIVADFAVSEHRAEKAKEEKPKCEIKTEYCSGSLMAKFKGTKKGDPEFWCCGACMAMLKRQGMKSSSLKRIG